jgi:hypothetical protein
MVRTTCRRIALRVERKDFLNESLAVSAVGPSIWPDKNGGIQYRDSRKSSECARPGSPPHGNLCSWVSLICGYAVPIPRIRGWFTGCHPIQASHWSHFSDLQRRALPRTETLCQNPQFTPESIHEVPIETWLKKPTGRGVERTFQYLKALMWLFNSRLRRPS